MRAIELVGTRVVPALCEELDRNKSRKEEEFNKISNALYHMKI
jgi:hypothetical protein